MWRGEGYTESDESLSGGQVGSLLSWKVVSDSLGHPDYEISFPRVSSRPGRVRQGLGSGYPSLEQ